MDFEILPEKFFGVRFGNWEKVLEGVRWPRNRFALRFFATNERVNISFD